MKGVNGEGDGGWWREENKSRNFLGSVRARMRDGYVGTLRHDCLFRTEVCSSEVAASPPPTSLLSRYRPLTICANCLSSMRCGIHIACPARLLAVGSDTTLKQRDKLWWHADDASFKS